MLATVVPQVDLLWCQKLPERVPRDPTMVGQQALEPYLFEGMVSGYVGPSVH